MNNFLNIGYKIRRGDGTYERYYGWDCAEIAQLEKAYYNNASFEIVSKIYEIENEFHKYEYDAELGVFHDFNEPADEITRIESDHCIAFYLWTQAIEADEDSVRAYKFMAIDIFGDFEKWRAMAFWHMMVDFERDVEYLKEVK